MQLTLVLYFDLLVSVVSLVFMDIHGVNGMLQST